MTENSQLPPAPSAPACRKKWIFAVGLLILALSVSIYILRSENPAFSLRGSTAQNASELSALEQKLASLETMLKETERPAPPPTPAPVPSPDLTLITEPLNRLEERLAAVESRSRSDQQDVRRFVAEAFAFWELREAARSDLGFAKELAALRAYASDDPAVTAVTAALEPYAASGVPTLPALRLGLARVEHETPLPTPDKAQPSIWDKIKAAFQPLIAVRPEKDPRFALLETALDAGDLSQALDAAKELPPETQAPLAPWRTQLEARIVVDAALKALSARFLEPPTLEKTP